MPLPFSGLSLIFEQMILSFVTLMEESITLGKGESQLMRIEEAKKGSLKTVRLVEVV